jgi:hypothetical protein
MILNSYRKFGGVHPETAALKNVMTFYGLDAPHTRKPFSEAMLLGIGGGLGSMYILWEFEKHGYPSLVLGFQNKANYPVKFLNNLAARIGATTKVDETTSKKKAAAQLQQTLAAGDPAIVWLDLGGKPYYRHFLAMGVAVAYGLEEDNVLLDNLAVKPYRIPADLMAAARAKVPSFKNRIMTIEPSRTINLEEAVLQGIQDCIKYLGASSTSFALPSLRKWSRMLTVTKNKKAWPVVHPGGRGLYGSLRTIYEGIEIIGTGGGGLRGLYADFLDEAAALLNHSDLKRSADHYRNLHARWSALAHAALPDQIEAFRTTKELLNRRAKIFREQGSEGLKTAAPIADKLHELKGELNDSFPMNAADTTALFADLQSHVEGIYLAEKEALADLEKAFNLQ